MKLLLDTVVLLLAATDDSRLSKEAKALIEDERNEVFFSAATILELALIEDRSPLSPTRLRQVLLDNDYQELPITSTHCLGVQFLPAIHTDFFARIRIAQSLAESAHLITQDPMCLQYPGVVSAKDLLKLSTF